MGGRVNQREIDAAASVHVYDYLIAKGELLEKTGGNYYKHQERDSLVIHESGKWYWNSKGKGGFGAISLATELYGLKFPDAVRDINELEIEPLKERSQTFEKEEFRYPIEYEVKGLENATRYLVEERHLDPKIVKALEKNGLIAEDKMKNIIFKWTTKDGGIVGGDRQGTVPIDSKRGYFKNIMANSKEDGGFSLDVGTPTKIAFFESPIDALSYFDLNRPNNIRLKSMSGLKDQVVMSSVRELVRECNQRGDQVEKIIFAVDNDPAGRDYAKKWEHIIGEDVLAFDFSQEKDWNEDLKKKRKFEKTLAQNKGLNLEPKMAMEGR